MKNLYKYISVSLLAMAGLTSCHNADIEFDDYEGGVSVYFAHQTPRRTLVMGEDAYNTDLDNAHKCKIAATMGGAYEGKDIKVNIRVDESLCTNLYREDDGSQMFAMPASYYQLSSNVLDFGGEFTGAVEVSFTDEFFNDPKAISGNYIIPVVMESQTGAKRILAGEYDTETNPTAPSRLSDKWTVVPQDYTLFCVKYISKFEGFFLRNVTELNGAAKSREAGKTCLDDPIVKTNTLGLYKVSYKPENYELILTFDANQACTVSAPDGANYTVSGSGEYRDHAEIKAWGDKDRDALYLNYTVSDGGNNVSVKETLILQRRGVKPEPSIKYVVK
jgi:hypothetical protein